MNKKLSLFIVVILLILNFFCWREIFALSENRNLKVYFLNVGQGDSAFIQTPDNRQILIDGGPDKLVLGKLSSLMPFWDKSIDIVILSHPELDHMGGLLAILKIYKADYILWTGVKRETPDYNEWMKVLTYQQKMGAKILIAKAGQEITAGSVLIDTVYPLEGVEGQELKDTSNDAGVVSRVIFGGSSFIFTGDISSKGEKDLVNSGENILSDVLKVAHHGSKYSTSDLFLANVKPTFAIIGVGKNSYGHPTQEALNRLQNFGIKIFRTDKDGDVEFVSDGKNINVL